MACARAKRAQVALAQEWAERFAPDRIVVHAMHSGWVETPGWRAASRRSQAHAPPAAHGGQGADTIVWLAAAPEAGRSSGEFWLDRRGRPRVKVPGTGSDPEERRRLWEACEGLAAA